MSRIIGSRFALEDGVDCYYEHGYGRTRITYLVPCDLCGNEIKYHSYNRNSNHICEYCKLKARNRIKQKKKIEIEQTKTKKELQFDKAVSRLKRKADSFEQYKNAIDEAFKHCEKYGSIPECLVAIELIRLGYTIIPQYRVGRYNIDFYIKEIDSFLEVDGSLYHNYEDDELRDSLIKKINNKNIIHILAEDVQYNVKLLDKLIKNSL